MSVALEIKNTKEVVLRNIDRAIEEALKGMIKETPGETSLGVNAEEIKLFEKWAKKLYLYFPKDVAAVIIDFVDEVHTGVRHLVKKMVERTVYDAIATRLHLIMAISELKKLCPLIVNTHVRQKTVEILLALYKHEDISSIASMHMEAALFRANDLTSVYLDKRSKDMRSEPALRGMSASELSKEMDQFHENAMNYFYRQAVQALEKEQETAKMEVHEKYPWAYKNLLQEKNFRKGMKGWLETDIFPAVKHIKKPCKPLYQPGMTCF